MVFLAISSRCACAPPQVLHRRVGARQERAGAPGGVRGKPVDGWLGVARAVGGSGNSPESH